MSDAEQPQHSAEHPGVFPAAYVPVVDPARTTRPTPAGHGTVLVISTAAFITNLVAGIGFPSNAPAEWLVNAGIGLALFATMVVSGVGLAVSLRRGLVRPNRVFPWLAFGFALISTMVWLAYSAGLWETLAGTGRGAYVVDVGGAFLTLPLWAAAPMFAGFALRRRGPALGTALSWAAIVLWVALVAGVVASAVLYSAGLTD
ncbi:hypothetical protein [Salinibacterium sp. ZJ70]|uniref:hypothetical protein n=1 Tax=Salinibacterium sp. ZJ70 TaxID=2708084 RepID=UPI001420FA03|nr:hypothetical protein [Salinibacterium sp. ZJ70]